MTKLTFSKPKYIINKGEKYVICQFDCIIRDTESKKSSLSFRVEGKAKCAPTDTYNEVTGKHIAESRAKYEAYRMAHSMYDNKVREVRERLHRDLDFLSFYYFTRYLKNNEKKHIKRLTEDESSNRP